jgi:hypothetical protein
MAHQERPAISSQFSMHSVRVAVTVKHIIVLHLRDWRPEWSVRNYIRRFNDRDFGRESGKCVVERKVIVAILFNSSSGYTEKMREGFG